MRRKIWKLASAVCLLLSMTMTAYAETSYGNSGWSVTFTNEKKMVSNFKNSDLRDSIDMLQPGDNVILTLSLKNENSTDTDWYMSNEVIESLEDSTDVANVASGGAYTYKLNYKAPGGSVTTLFDSDAVGGEDEDGGAGESGLHQATNALEDWFFLGTLSKGQSGQITLEVALDGDTQGNDYQNTLAELNMNFAVELNTTGTGTQNPNPGTGTQGDIVKTGDEMSLTPFIIVACVTGTLLLLLAGYCEVEREKEKKRGGRDKV